MKTFILTAMLAATAVSGVVIASHPVAAGCCNGIVYPSLELRLLLLRLLSQSRHCQAGPVLLSVRVVRTKIRSLSAMWRLRAHQVALLMQAATSASNGRDLDRCEAAIARPAATGVVASSSPGSRRVLQWAPGPLS